MLSSDHLTGVCIRNINSASQLTSTVLRHILLHNKNSLEHLGISYATDVLREETRIAFEEIGLDELPNLRSISLNMNRAYLLYTNVMP
mmetsp:Transcript_22856/g.30461  ORF Transcript_22856/g.30461 Transcript_22856/m.30461 type:complete len:88 (+) Transcript_22856:437-700(+)